MAKDINLHYVSIDHSPTPPHIDAWLSSILSTDGHLSSWAINYVFCDDDYLHKINVEYLNHDTFTDIITFPLEVNDEHITADIFISIERVKENASHYEVKYEDELLRVMAHGILHLLGYGDKSEEEALAMRSAENNAIAKYYTYINA